MTKIHPAIAEHAMEENEKLREALRWYEEKVTECRKIGSLGDNARQALDLDGGFRARDALSKQAEPAPAQDERASTSDVRDALKFYEKATGRFVVPQGVSEHQDQFVQGWLAKTEQTSPAQTAPQGKFRMGDMVKKTSGSEWVGRVVGWYSTEQTKEGYAVESSAHRNSVQIYPAKALELVPMDAKEA